MSKRQKTVKDEFPAEYEKFFALNHPGNAAVALYLCVNGLVPKESDTSSRLMLAIAGGNRYLFDFVKDDIKFRGDVTRRCGSTTLHMAVTYNSLYAVMQMIPWVNLNAQDNDGNTAAHCAVKYLSECSEYMIQVLIEKGADMSIKNNEGEDVLMSAVSSDNRECLARLLTQGADDTAVNSVDETAFEMAEVMNRPYATREAWDGMKARMSCLDILRTLSCLQQHPLCAALSSETLLQTEEVFSFVEETKDMRFVSRNQKVYRDYALAVIKAFNSLSAEERNNVPFDYFLPFVGTNLSRQQSLDMMKVLVCDRPYEYGRYLGSALNPDDLNLDKMDYDESLGLVSLSGRYSAKDIVRILLPKYCDRLTK